ncbi:hypothetical protein PM082_022449 [Marasmius tenuissimus]|nr:hypothetical protein PM082_022449 [Marasmius tenuissimus]
MITDKPQLFRWNARIHVALCPLILPLTFFMSKFFRNPQRLRISGGSFSHVEGNQHNYYNYTDPNQRVKKGVKARRVLDEFHLVKRGAIYKMRDIGLYMYPRCWDDGSRERWDEGKLRADRTICAAKVLNRPGMVFTVVQYSGPESRKAFEDDLTTFQGRCAYQILSAAVIVIWN